MERETPPDYSREEIVVNINKLKYKLEVCLIFIWMKITFSNGPKGTHLYLYLASWFGS
jgi:hypothetical protein